MDRINVLVVDDEPEIRELIVRHVHDNGWTAVPAANGIDALALLKKFTFDVVVSDITMPVLGGMAFMNAVRLSGNNVPFVFLTASSESSHIKEALRLGAFDYFEKPVGRDVLVKTLARAMELSAHETKISIRLESSSDIGDVEKKPLAQIRAKNNLKR